MGRLTMAYPAGGFSLFNGAAALLRRGPAGDFIIPGRNTRAIKLVSAVFSGLTLVISIYLYIAYDQQAGVPVRGAGGMDSRAGHRLP
jgi:hypothetical protein